jgi:hypothetical protein
MIDELKTAIKNAGLRVNNFSFYEKKPYTVISVDVLQHNYDAWMLAMYLNETNYKYSITPIEIDGVTRKVDFDFKTQNN